MKKLKITARPIEVAHYSDMGTCYGIEYYFEGKYIGYSSSYGNLVINFTDSAREFYQKQINNN